MWRNSVNTSGLFNFGSRTGIDLPNENIGSLYTTENMHEVELATNTFGQGFTSTMIQEIAAFSAVVNGGYYYQPHMVKQILNDQGGVVKTNDPILLRQPISESTSKVLQEALEMGVLYGTGKKAWVPGYRIGGKTGTAEKINPENRTALVRTIHRFLYRSSTHRRSGSGGLFRSG
ncbi:MAG: penicillin-binding transpeptidase domain-containing protein [Blautia sp.]